MCTPVASAKIRRISSSSGRWNNASAHEQTRARIPACGRTSTSIPRRATGNNATDPGRLRAAPRRDDARRHPSGARVEQLRQPPADRRDRLRARAPGRPRSARREPDRARFARERIDDVQDGRGWRRRRAQGTSRGSKAPPEFVPARDAEQIPAQFARPRPPDDTAARTPRREFPRLPSPTGQGSVKNRAITRPQAYRKAARRRRELPELREINPRWTTSMSNRTPHSPVHILPSQAHRRGELSNPRSRPTAARSDGLPGPR